MSRYVPSPLGSLERLLLLSVLALVIVGSAHARRATHVINAKVSIVQHGTIRIPHPPPGDAGDVFITTLLMSNTAPAFGKGAGASIGAMLFQYVLHGTCSTESCAGATADIVATSRLPGGTIIASEKHVALGRPPIVIPITSGTRAYKGASGSVTIGAAAAPYNTYHIILP